MTTAPQNRAPLSWATLLLGATLGGCAGSSAPRADAAGVADAPAVGRRCALEIATINGQQATAVATLDAADDQDLVEPGLQIEVVVTGDHLVDDALTSLAVTGLDSALRARARDGQAIFAGVPVAEHLSTVLLQARARGCAAGPELELALAPVPNCVLLTPRDGATLGPTDDLDPDNPTLDVDVLVSTANAEGGALELLVGKSAPGSEAVSIARKIVGAQGQAFFPGVALPEGHLELTGRLTVGATERRCRARITARRQPPPCALTPVGPPPVELNGDLGLGAAHDGDLARPGMQLVVEVATDDDAEQVTLLVDGAPRLTTTAEDGRARFAGVELPEGQSRLSARCAAGTTVGASATATVLVDSVAPTAPGELDCEVIDRRAGDVRCCWTTVADDDGGGSALARYELRYSTPGPLTVANWQAGTLVATQPAPGVGQPRCVSHDGLALGRDYTFGLRAFDEVGNGSPVASPPDALAVDLAQQLLAGPSPTSAWGERAAAGDYNCDGHVDLAVGDPLASSGRGRVAIYLGSEAGLTSQPHKAIVGTVAGGQLGAAIAVLPAMDADGQGCADLAVLAAHGETAASQRVYVYLGRATLIQRSDVLSGTGAELRYVLGPGLPGQIVGVASAGDIDGDGATDLALSYHDANADAAEVWIAYGDVTLSPLSPTGAPKELTMPLGAGVRLLGGKATEAFGAALCGGGSVDGDGFADLLFSAPELQQGIQPRGAVFVLRGAPRAALLPDNIDLFNPRVQRIDGDASNTSLGRALAVVGDMNGDGLIELAASDPSANNDQGAVYLFRLANGPKSTADAVATITGKLPGVSAARLGAGLACGPATAGAITSTDLNGDGLADLLIGVETLLHGDASVIRLDGRKQLSTLDAATPSYIYTVPADSIDLASRPLIAGDIDGDGHVDVALGDSGFDAGRGRIVVYH